MKNTLKVGIVGLSLLLPLLPGCGTGSGTTSTAQSGANSVSRGAVTIQINFPSGKNVRKAVKSGLTRVPGFSNGNIPVGTQAVKVEVVTTSSPETSLAVPQVITSTTAPTGGAVAAPATATFTNLAVGTVRVRVTAYPDVAAQTNPIAIGTSDIAITVNATATANVPLGLTIDHIAVTPAAFNLSFQPPTNSQLVSATPMDKNNNPLRMALIYTVDRPDVVIIGTGSNPPNTPLETTTFVVLAASPTNATIPATATLTIAEPNSGKTATATATQTGTAGSP